MSSVKNGGVMNEGNMGTIRIDQEFAIPIYSPICTLCKHLHLDGERICTAFPGGIPLEIWRGENDHTEPWPGDHGIRFERVELK